VKSLFPDDSEILAIAESKQAETDALPYGSEKHNLQKEANSYKILKSFRRQKRGLPGS
jgi:hypothetical protein